MSSPSFEAFLSAYPPAVQALARDARDLVRQALPEAMEVVDPPSGIVAYGASARYADPVCAIAPFSAHVNLMFARGASLPDPDNLLRAPARRPGTCAWPARRTCTAPA